MIWHNRHDPRHPNPPCAAQLGSLYAYVCVLVSLTLVHAAEHVSTIGPSTRPPGAMGQYTPSPDPDVAMPTHPTTAPRTKTRVVHVHVRGSAEWRRNPSFPTPSFTSGDSSSAPVAPAPRRIANQSRSPAFQTRVETAATTTNARALLRPAGTRFNLSRIGSERRSSSVGLV